MRNVAILRDGYSDFLVLRKFISCVWENYKGESLGYDNFIDLEKLNITNSLQEYLHKTRREGNYSYYTAEATTLVSSLISIYFGCFKRIEREIDVVTSQVLVVVSADSEQLLKERNNYFHDWAYNIRGLLLFSIEQFYEHMSVQGYTIEYLPLIVPVILFPSSEILVASCMYDMTREQCRSLHPNPALKEKVYGTSSIPDAIETGVLEETLETYLTSEGLKGIYNEIPEVRMLMHTLAI